jgi:hypothetical protein
MVSLLGLHWVERALFRTRVTRVLIRLNGPILWGALIALSFWMLALPRSSLNPFIYFRF